MQKKNKFDSKMISTHQTLKVLHINDFMLGGGAENVFLETYRLTKVYFDSRYYAPNQTFKQGALPNVVRYFWRDKNLSLLLNSFEPDVIHVHNFHNRIGASLFLAIRNLKKKPKVVWTAHDFFLLWPNPSYCYFKKGQFIKFENPPDWLDFLTKSASREGIVLSLLRKITWIYLTKILRIQQEIDLIVTPSKFLNDLMSGQFQMKTLTIRNPTEFPSSTGTAVKSSKKVRMIFLGRLSPEKGLMEFLRHAAKLQNRQFELDIFGSGESRHTIETLIKEYELHDTMRLMGHISASEKNAIIKEYDVLVLPSIWHENAPLTVVEGAAAGLRLLVSNFGGMRELAEMAGGYYLFDPKDFTSFEMAINGCIRDVLMNKPVDRDIQGIMANFSKKQYQDNISNLYRSIAQPFVYFESSSMK